MDKAADIMTLGNWPLGHWWMDTELRQANAREKDLEAKTVLKFDTMWTYEKYDHRPD